MKIRRILAAAAMITAAAAGTVYAVNAAPADVPDNNLEPYYIFDVEPMQTGRYYLGGDTESCYLELTENTIMYSGTREQTEKLISQELAQLGWGDAEPAPPAIDRVLDEWHEPKRYFLYRFGRFPDKVRNCCKIRCAISAKDFAIIIRRKNAGGLTPGKFFQRNKNRERQVEMYRLFCNSS